MNISLVILPSLVTNEYLPNNGLLKSSSYANGDAIRYGYTNSGLVSQIYVDNNAESTYPLYTWAYSSNGLPRIHKDGVTGYKYDYSYDSIGRLIRTDISKSSDSSYVGSTEYGYDVRNNLTSIVNDIGGNAYKQIYGYYNTGVGNAAEDTKDNLPTRYIVLGVNTDYTYDSLNKLTKKTVDTTTDIVNQYYYNTLNDENDEIINYTSQLRCEVINGISYHYEYDDVGNITAIKKGTSADDENPSEYRAYSYDNKYQLESETIGSTINQWTYDGLGNIETKTTTVNGTSTGKITYTYGADSSCGWNNLLTQLTISDYTNNTTTTETIDYDAIGNPITYRGATLSWYGRQMKSFAKDGTTITMGYDADGLRSSKTVAGVKTEYQYVGDKLFYENRGNGDSFYYFYDSYGKLSAIYHHRNGTKVAYHVVTNAQGDVVALYNWSGTNVASYEYDAWGNCTIVSDSSSTGIATLNPFRYRGYYYDTDLGLYYLQSRYYDAEIGRFINSDNVTDPNAGLMGYNTYVYCANNPVNATDPTGHGLIENIGKWVWQNIKTTAKLFSLPFRHIEGSVGLGKGLGGSFDIKATDDILGVTFKYSTTKIFEYSSDEASYYSKTGLETGISVIGIIDTNSFTGVSHMLNDEKCTCTYGDFNNLRKCPANTPCNEVNTDYGISGALYLGYGGEFSVGINIESMLEEKKEIWSEYYDFRDSIKIF